MIYRMFDFVKQHKGWVGLVLLVLVVAIWLRTTNLMGTAPSLYWEEAALGYDAYSIAQTGKDHHGNTWPLVAFESFGDWKPSLYFYALVPFVTVWGLEPWVVRAPSVVSGLAIVVAVGWLSYLLAQKLNLKGERWYGLVGLLVATFSPWAIQFSRAGWEVNLATALVSWGMVLGLQAVQVTKSKTKVHYFFKSVRAVGSVLLLVLAVYAYHGTRVIAPLLGLLLGLDWVQQLRQAKFDWLRIGQVLMPPAILAVLLMAPVLISLKSPQITQRFAETSIFSQLDVIEESNAAKEAAGNDLVSSVFYHRYLLFGREILHNYFDHFNLQYLVVAGDVNPRHSTQYGGILHYQDLLFLALGVMAIIYGKKRIGWIILGWWLISIVPAALTTATPHALRTLPGMPAVLVMIALGLGLCFEWLKKMITLKPVLLATVVVIAGSYLGTFAFWWHHYQQVYPVQTSSEWQYGYKEMVSAVNQLKAQHPELPVYITREQGRPAMYYWFFSKTNPIEVQAANATSQKDQGEFITFETLSFPNTVSEVKADSAIVASSPEGKEQLLKGGYKVEDEVVVSNLAGKSVWSVYSISN